MRHFLVILVHAYWGSSKKDEIKYYEACDNYGNERSTWYKGEKTYDHALVAISLVIVQQVVIENHMSYVWKCHKRGHVERICRQMVKPRESEMRQRDLRKKFTRQQVNVVNEEVDKHEGDNLFVVTYLCKR